MNSTSLKSRARGLAGSLLDRLRPAPDLAPRAEAGLGRSPLPSLSALPTADGLDPCGLLALRAGLGDVPTDLSPALGPPHGGEAGALRLFHQAALWWWARLPLPAEQALAGAAAAQSQALLWGRPAAEPPLRAQLDAARVFAAFAWPGLPGSRTLQGEGLVRLAHSLDAAIPGDGGPPGLPAELARLVRAGRLAQAAAEASHGALPALGLAALDRAETALVLIRGERGDLPVPALPPLLPLGADAPALLRPPPLAAPLAGREWRAWALREAGVGLAWRTLKGGPSRLYGAASGLLCWEGPMGRLLSGHRPLHGLRSARVDGPRALLRFGEGGATRELMARQARLIVTDLGATELEFRLPDLAWVAADEGFEARGPGFVLALKPEPRWRWALTAGGRLHGVGVGEARTSLELR